MNKYTSAAVLALLFANANTMTIKNKLRQTTDDGTGADGYNPADLAGTADGSSGDGTTWSEVGRGWGEHHGTASAMGRHVGELFDEHFGGSWSALGDHVETHFGDHIDTLIDPESYDDLGDHLEYLHEHHGNGSWGDLGTVIGDAVGSWGAFGNMVGDAFGGSISAANDHVATHFSGDSASGERRAKQDDYDPATLGTDDGSAGDDGTTWSQIGSDWGEHHGTASAMGRHVGDLFDEHFGGSWSALGDHVETHFGDHIDTLIDPESYDNLGDHLQYIHEHHAGGSWGDLGDLVGDHVGSWGAFGNMVGDAFGGSVSAANDHVATHFSGDSASA